MKKIVECKFEKGPFASYGVNEDPHKTALEIAEDYISNPIRDLFAFPMVAKGGRGGHGCVKIVLYERETVLAAKHRFETEGRNSAPALGYLSRGVGIARVEEMAIRQTFGRPVAVFETEYVRIADIPRDPNCPNAPRARSWEKIVAKKLNGIWVGGLHNVQYDVVLMLD